MCYLQAGPNTSILREVVDVYKADVASDVQVSRVSDLLQVFGQDRQVYQKLPRWRQVMLKKKHGLF